MVTVKVEKLLRTDHVKTPPVMAVCLCRCSRVARTSEYASSWRVTRTMVCSRVQPEIMVSGWRAALTWTAGKWITLATSLMRCPVTPSVTPIGGPTGEILLQSWVTLVPQALIAQETSQGVSAASPGSTRTAVIRINDA
eukprot:12562667-Heterocapsa_arctica.AAC.2